MRDCRGFRLLAALAASAALPGMTGCGGDASERSEAAATPRAGTATATPAEGSGAREAVTPSPSMARKPSRRTGPRTIGRPPNRRTAPERRGRTRITAPRRRKPAAPASPIITLSEFGIRVPARRLVAGRPVTIVNRGTARHVLAIKGTPVAVTVPPGARMPLLAALTPGEHTLVCRLHGGRGMRQTVTVTRGS